MENVLEKYLDGDKVAEAILIDETMEQYNYSITNQEAKLLIIKKHGKPEIFW